ncbi:unnamed protein product [Merluccius merluccius]
MRGQWDLGLTSTLHLAIDKLLGSISIIAGQTQECRSYQSHVQCQGARVVRLVMRMRIDHVRSSIQRPRA